MAADGATDTERPTVSVVEGSGNDIQPASPAATRKPSVARANRKRAKAISKKPDDKTVVLANALVISPEKAIALRAALEEFRTILVQLVQDPTTNNIETVMEKSRRLYVEG